MKIPYYTIAMEYGVSLARLKPTGRCKIIDDGKTSQYYVQHKGLIFKSWIHVRRIEWHDHTITKHFTIPLFDPEQLTLEFEKQQAIINKARREEELQ